MKKHSIKRFVVFCLISFAICIINSNYACAQCGIEASGDTTLICGSSVQLGANPKWVTLNSGITSALYSVCFTSADTGYAVGGVGGITIGGVILKTTDGGVNWIQQTSGTYNTLYSVYFPAADTGYVVGDLGTILKTTDGGLNWVTQPLGSWINPLNSVYFIDTDTGYVVGGSGIIFKTTDGGTSWVKQTPGFGSSVTLYSVFLLSADTAYAVGSMGTILKTTDGGINWITQNSGSSLNDLYSVYFTDVNNGFASGSLSLAYGKILKTTDGGANWVTQSFSNYTSKINSLFFIDSNNGYAVGAGEKVLYTTNGGNSWDVQSKGTSLILNSVCFTKQGGINTGYAVGYNGIILKLNMPVSYLWSPANGLSATNISNPVASPTDSTAKYILTTTTANSCIAKDTVTIYVNPLTANAGMDKTIICGGSVQLNNVATNYTGTGTLTYLWSPSAGLNYDSVPNPTVNVTNDTKYFVTITTPNSCIAIDSVIVHVNPLTADAGSDKTIICGGTAQITVTSNYTGTGQLSYLWSPVTGLNYDTIQNPTVTISSNNTYTITVSTPNGCIATDNVSVSIIPMNAPEICIVGVDSSNKNIVVWNKPISSAIDSFYIYKETNITNMYQKIGSVSFDNLSVFVDTNSFPNVQSNKYKISIKDNCGPESAQSDYHKTMHLNISQGMGNTWNLSWEAYEGFTVSTYNVYRGTAPNNLQLIGTSSGSNTSYSDLTASSGYLYYQVEVVSPNNCNPSKSYNSSRSNIATNNLNGIYENSNTSYLFSIYPNPASDIVTLNINNTNNEDFEINIYNILGISIRSEIHKQNNCQINIGDLSNGVYMVTIKSKDFTEKQKLIIQR